MRIVGIAGDDDGSVNSGKSEAARAIETERCMVVIALADPIKRIAAELYGFTREQLWGHSSERNRPDRRWPMPGDEAKHARAMYALGESSGDGGLVEQFGPIGWLTPRRACQMIGTEGGRDIHPETWTRALVATAQEVVGGALAYEPWHGVYRDSALFPRPAGVVVPDVRHANEADAIRACGGMVLGVHRPGAARLAGDAADHPSEHGMRGVARDAVVVNDGTLQQLAARSLAAVDEFFRGRGETAQEAAQ